MPTEPFSMGVVNARDRGDLQAGEMQSGTGAFYRPNDPRVHTIGGRTVFGDTGTAKKVHGAHVAEFDDGTGRVLALSNQVLYSATISGTGLTGTFSSLKTGYDANATNLSVQHFNDRHYITTGDVAVGMQVLEDDGAVYTAGMKAPTVAPTLTPSASGGLIEEPDSASGTFTNESFAWDADSTTYANADLSGSGTTTTTFSFASGVSNAGTGRKLVVEWELAGLGIPKDFPADGAFDDVGGGIDSGFDVTVKIEVSENAGSSYTTILNRENVRFPLAQRTATVDVTDMSVDVRDVRVRVTFTYNDGLSQASLRIYEIRVQNGSITPAFTLTTGLYYAIGEFDQSRGHYSPPGKPIQIGATAFGTSNLVTINLPAAAKNSRSTHWVIYRTADGGATTQLGILSDGTPITETTYDDDFTVWAATDQPRPLYRQITLSLSDGSTGSAPLDSPPPELVHLFPHDGSLCGLSRTNPRALYYTPAGEAESWPEIFVISKFLMPQNDQLQTAVSLGDIIIVVAKSLAFRVTGLPRSVRSTFESDVRPIQSAPGGVGRKCLTTFSVAGESRAAWISHEGIVQTNGEQVYRISDDFDWTAVQDYDKSQWVLAWDPRRLCLVFCWSSTGASTNDRYALIHMHPDHRKPNGQPKWTFPHYGKINALSVGQVGNTRRMYSAHASDGKVYVEDYGNTDASNAYDANGTNPLLLTSRRLYGGDEYSALGGHLRHTDFGTGQTCTVTWTTGRDWSERTQTKTKTVSLSGHRRTFFDVALGGEWSEYTIQHTGNAQGALADLSFDVRSLGKEGEVKIA